eukprot:m.145980 g.145980  ORF g.145980 m.145980 type:complete len:109 (+) comp17236_c0_seq2:1110-1436(+)
MGNGGERNTRTRFFPTPSHILTPPPSQLKATCDGVLSADGKSCSGPWQQPDAENWCGKRDGDDFPSSLLSPYSENYVEPPVFAQVSAASSVAVSVWMLALAAILACLF